MVRFLISIISVKRSGKYVSSGNHEFDKLAINTKKIVELDSVRRSGFR